MNGLFFYIGLGLGLAAACGLRPFLPVLLAGVLGSAGALGVGFAEPLPLPPGGLVAGRRWRSCSSSSYLLQLRLDQERFPAPPLAAAIVGAGGGGRRAAVRGHARRARGRRWPGLIGGAAAAALALRASGPVVLGARSRLPDRAAREALTIYLDAAALLLAALVALLHPLGYVLLALLAVLLVRTRQRAGEKYAGLRILRR